MSLRKGFDIKLVKVSSEGLPRNRAEWCYKLTIPKGKHKAICIDLKGSSKAFSDPSILEGKKATDADRLAWGGVKEGLINPKLGKTLNNLKTLICLKVKDSKKPFAGGDLEFCFIGPADGAGPGKISIESHSFVKRKNSKSGHYRDLEHGRKSGVEIPLLAFAGKEELDNMINDGAVNTIGLAPPEISLTITKEGDFVSSAFEQELDINFEDALNISDDLLPSEIEKLSLAAIKGLNDTQQAVLAETLAVETIDELLQHPSTIAISKLLDVLGS